ncbi:hypothetical protein M2113_001377 [Aurantimicrobium minutum]|uniref:hypothetical protein n=1 Tax=Aurantimicrobium minutum TaxID=708131 RepID=UPI002476592D|nr:hypothetical protein [Aurantimicrobium minutum]MDH6410391.1 hypothetical protein [Aurantimicrobium minutum]
MNIVVIAALIQAVIALGVAIFQIALVAGAPLGEYTMGGQHPGKLPGQFRVTAAVSAIIMVAQSGHYLAQAGILNPALSPGQNAIVNWFWFGFAVLGLIVNSISRSKKERNLWVPVLLVSAVCTLLVALNV